MKIDVLGALRRAVTIPAARKKAVRMQVVRVVDDWFNDRQKPIDRARFDIGHAVSHALGGLPEILLAAVMAAVDGALQGATRQSREVAEERVIKAICRALGV